MVAGLIPLVLWRGRRGRTALPATAAAAAYMGVLMALTLIFPGSLFRVEPKLAPIRFPLTR